MSNGAASTKIDLFFTYIASLSHHNKTIYNTVLSPIAAQNDSAQLLLQELCTGQPVLTGNLKVVFKVNHCQAPSCVPGTAPIFHISGIDKIKDRCKWFTQL